MGEPIYPEDFFSPNLGFLIYLAWPLPNCAPDCPWAYVGDEQCDRSCFNENCQFDGGDCSVEKKRRKKHSHIEEYEESDENMQDDEFEYYESLHKQNLITDNKNIKPSVVKSINLNNTYNISNIKNIFVNNKNNKFEVKLKQNNFTFNYSNNTMNFIKVSNSSKRVFNVSDFVNKHNENIILDDHLRRRKVNRNLRKHKRFYKQFVNKQTSENSNKTHNGYEIYNGQIRNTAKTDTYGMSLQYTNRVFNKAYEFISRKVPAHSPIMIDRDIMGELQDKFSKEFRKTAGNKLRASNDMQYSFSYYYYLISESVNQSISEIFNWFDTDASRYVFLFLNHVISAFHNEELA